MITATTLGRLNFLQPRSRLFVAVLAFTAILWFGWLRSRNTKDTPWILHNQAVASPLNMLFSSASSIAHPLITPSPPTTPPELVDSAAESINGLDGRIKFIESIANTAQHFIKHPLAISQFGEMGKRVQVVRGWMETHASLSGQIPKAQHENLYEHIEKTILSLFPFLQNSSQPKGSHALSHLRQSFQPESKGIVIPTGKRTFRFACHLIKNVRHVLKSTLPIQVMYAGATDLPAPYRKLLASEFADVELVDITTAFDDDILQLRSGRWAIKAFAALASRFEQVILLDADAVFLQDPGVVFTHHTGYNNTGALLFHDRLLWQGAFVQRHEWWEKQLEHHTPSATLAKSLVYNEKYAEECDSGMVVIDKRRLSILLGLLHVCWQNMRAVREAHTYVMGHGDKESWWFGFELSDANYTFENHYGSILGSVKSDAPDGKTRVCGFTIAHLDEDDRLFWYNGSLLKNKAVNKDEFDVPAHWMMDGVWEKGTTKANLSCMRDARVVDLTVEERNIIQESVDAATAIDGEIKGLD